MKKKMCERLKFKQKRGQSVCLLKMYISTFTANCLLNDNLTLSLQKIAATSQRLLQFSLLCLCAVLINVSITPWFILLTAPICIVYYGIQKFYRCSARLVSKPEEIFPNCY